MPNRFFTSIDEVAAIPQEDLPLLVLSSNQQSFLSYAICARTNGQYNHFMWMIRPGYLASQEWWYREIPVQNHKGSRLKLWHNPNWTKEQREKLAVPVCRYLLKGRWETRYDLLNIVGQLCGYPQVQAPWTKICSEHAENLKLVDPSYDLYNPDPEDVNRWLSERPEYAVYGRYIPD